ncbi:hypothetical protein BHYA_0136g00350 [Botrytis hyacinthi]|uniref:Pinin/SDK/MemA protein domain-containing protein n=1 Tax=Botrytis hyacinthi TaxID=278943 RepID=A0A4Z1GKS7_9HELO|nr:hypothetical protein BHYA_0136g00350 [Botrytis hyacinthi]
MPSEGSRQNNRPGSGPDPTKKRRTRLNAFAQLKNKTNTPKAQAATKAEHDSMRSGFHEIYKVLEDVTSRMEAEKKEHDEKIEKERLRLRREEIEKNVADYRAKQNKDEEELKRIGNSAAASGEKKRPERTRASSSTDKSKKKGTVKKSVT